MDFLHIEPIRERSGAHDWIIQEHSHPEHVQILLVEHGGGLYRVEGEEIAVPTGSLILVPAGLVHGFEFSAGTDGFVINAATAYLRAVAGQDMRLLEPLSQPAVHPVAETDPATSMIPALFRGCYREYVWSAPGRRAAIRGQVLQMLVALMRAAAQPPHRRPTGPRPGRFPARPRGSRSPAPRPGASPRGARSRPVRRSGGADWPAGRSDVSCPACPT
ncbi:AraC family ligand binding domain-containing protein [Mangrovicoccus ximenensis]|uniref:AraC family ligand binding domain-containing protein n=1 Tax=Mangrovicoccus ximenensis TaxID=1911570 RepID=UPI0022AAC1C6|nr:AraC family ligand binding domain-containing protein [Mangrovicoccus ximenensis]